MNLISLTHTNICWAMTIRWRTLIYIRWRTGRYPPVSVLIPGRISQLTWRGFFIGRQSRRLSVQRDLCSRDISIKRRSGFGVLWLRFWIIHTKRYLTCGRIYALFSKTSALAIENIMIRPSSCGRLFRAQRYEDCLPYR